jgi:RimJ/RimL family protein N-acetyltransferase
MLFPHTDSQRLTLRPAGTADAATVYDILFRLGRGGLPMIDQFIETFGRGLSASFLIYPRGVPDAEPIGFSTLSDISPAGHLRAEVNVLAAESQELLVEAYALTVNFAFAMWRTRKVYIHMTSADLPGVGFGADHSALLRQEAVLSDYTFSRGRVWDVHVLAVYRDEWDTLGVDLLKQIV